MIGGAGDTQSCQCYCLAGGWLGKHPAGSEDEAGPRGVHRDIVDGIPVPLRRLQEQRYPPFYPSWEHRQSHPQ